MRHSGAMGAVQGIGDLQAVFQRLIERKRALLDPGGECLAFHKLHHHVTHAILIADVMEHANIRMVQRSYGTRLALEALAKIFALGDVLGQELMATSRPRRVSRALDTSPIPPAPMGERIS